MKRTRVCTLLVIAFACALSACRNAPANPAAVGPRALPPQEALQSLKLSEDFQVELFLSEPQVNSPVEMVFDENGRLYVAEMLDYPDDPPPGKPARSRIRLLEDNDGDGQYERAVIFAEQVLQVSGLLPWQGGVLVTSAPDILWLKDNDGDGKADVKKVLYTGFPKVNPEHRITNLRYGLDNWVYAANHGNDGRITAPHHPERPPLLIRGADFRFHPVRDVAETTSGTAQFGLTFDDWQNTFITENTAHLRHVILPMKYIARAPLLDVPAYAFDISDHGKPSAPMYPLTQPQEWRKQRTALRQQRYDENKLNRTEQVGGYFSGASGSTVYNGDNFPDEYRGNVFTADVSGNLVHRDVLAPDGVTFKASRSKDKTEFLASTDEWFRPCNFANAPDGNLYLLDVYRMFIETPESIPEEIKKGMDFYAGDTMGRIYRLVPNKPRVQRNLLPKLGQASTAELVKYLEHANGWHRYTAQRLLIERQDKAAIALLKEMAEKNASALSRAHALWTLEGLSALNETLVLKTLKDSDTHLREHGLRLAETFLPKSKTLANAILAMTSDADTRVQFQTAFTLGQLKDARALSALAQMAEQRGGEQWFRLAILSSAAESASQFLPLLLAKTENSEMITQLAAMIGAKHDASELSQLLASFSKLKKPEAGLNGVAKGLRLAGVKNLSIAGAETALTPFLNSTNEAVQKAAWDVARHLELRALVAQAASDAPNASLPLNKRVLAVRALRGGQYASVQPILQKLLAPTEPPEIQNAAIESLAAFDEQNIAPLLLANWRSYLPDVRQKALNALLTNQEWMRTLLKAAEEEQVERAAFDPAARARLVDHPDKTVAERAQKFFKDELSDRAQLVSSWLDAAQLTGDVARGKKLFEDNCAKCHLPQREKARIGADLSGINNKTKEELIASILNPSQAIEPRFVNYIVTTKDGHIYDGVLGNETPGSLTLRGGAEGDLTILRKNIAELRSSKISLMPDGFEKQLNKQALADVLAYLRGGL